MKRGNFIRELVDAGCYLKRYGRKYDLYINPRNGKQAPVPRHPEIKEGLCELIRKQLGLKGK
ncbi:type II toxin-antitoxin system HicA family toxin [Nitrosomonas communis]|uniref:type II toxin-antitoxin system HicA family toxin n=1 Tax=Nitrosomonas communis TaxID=44574 RepID=UPI0034E9891A